MKCGELIDIVIYNLFLGNILSDLEDWLQNPCCFLSYQGITVAQKPIMIFFLTLLEVCIQRIKDIEHCLIKMNRPHNIGILSKT